MGIPFELIGGGYDADKGAKKSLENSRLFTTNMVKVCNHLQTLLTSVYVACYGGKSQDICFTLRATPRIEINTVADICALIDCGLVSTSDACSLSNMILGLDIRQATGELPRNGHNSPAYETPAHKRMKRDGQVVKQ